MELIVYPESLTESISRRLMEVLSQSDVLIYAADMDNLDSTEKVFVCL